MTVQASCSLMVDATPIAAVSSMGQVESGRDPGGSGMALIASHSCEQSGMVSRVRVTGYASSGENGEHRIGMAFCAIQAGMCTGQREFRQRMIERCWKPTAGGMTGATSVTKLTLMGVIFGVACGAVL